MATDPGILAWRIAWTEEPGGPWGRKKSDATERLTLTQFTSVPRHVETVFEGTANGRIWKVLQSSF